MPSLPFFCCLLEEVDMWGYPVLYYFFEGLSKQSDVTTLTWGKGACKFLRHEFDMMAVFFEVQTQAWTNSLLHLPQPQSKHTLIFKAATQLTKKHKIFFLFYGCANASLSKFPFALAKTPIQTHFHLHSWYPQTKNVPPEAELHKLRVSHSAQYSARPQKAVNTMGLALFGQLTEDAKYCLFLCFLFTFWERPCAVACTVACTVRALYVRCAKHDVCNSVSGGVEAHSTLVHHARHIKTHSFWSPIFAHMRSTCCNGSSFEDESVFGLF